MTDTTYAMGGQKMQGSLVRQGKVLDGKMEKDACTATWVSASELKLDCTGTQAGATVWTFTSTSRK